MWISPGKNRTLRNTIMGFFDSNFFDWAIRLAHLVEQFVVSTGCTSRTAQSKKSKTFLNTWHRSSHHKSTRPQPLHYYSAEAGYCQCRCFSPQDSVEIASSVRQQRVSHNGRSARCPKHFVNYGCSYGGSRLSTTTRSHLWRLSAKSNITNPLGRGFMAREARVARGECTDHKNFQPNFGQFISRRLMAKKKKKKGKMK